tara:strand:+ start:140 stop:586 length:447 start_codon:yes stop_codon:yes gene_type:complete
MNKGLLTKVISKIIKKGYYYSIDCEQGIDLIDDDYFQKPTNDIKLLCNQTPKDKYVGVNNLDVCTIYFHTEKQAKIIDKARGEFESDAHVENYIYEKYNDEDGLTSGYLQWNAFNSGSDRITDYSVDFESIIDKTIDSWQKELDNLLA